MLRKRSDGEKLKINCCLVLRGDSEVGGSRNGRYFPEASSPPRRAVVDELLDSSEGLCL